MNDEPPVNEISVDAAEFEFIISISDATDEQLREDLREREHDGWPTDLPLHWHATRERIPVHWKAEIRRLLGRDRLIWDEGVMWLSPNETSDAFFADQAPLILKYLCSVVRDTGEEPQIWPEHIPQAYRRQRVAPAQEERLDSD